MKKVILLVALLAMAGLASATDVGVYGLYEKGTNGKSQDALGLSIGENLNKLSPSLNKVAVRATFDRSTSNVTTVNRYTATASYDVFKLGPVQTNVRAGLAYLDPQSQKAGNGGAGLIGAGAVYPVSQKVSLVADYAYQKGNNITKNYNGNIFTAGAKYSF
jgi:outer membrane autotransporter protein